MNGKWMMEALECAWWSMPDFTDEESREVAFPPDAKACLTNKYMRENLMAVSFRSFNCRNTGWDPRWTNNLPAATADNMKATMAELLAPKEHGAIIMLNFWLPWEPEQH